MMECQLASMKADLKVNMMDCLSAASLAKPLAALKVKMMDCLSGAC